MRSCRSRRRPRETAGDISESIPVRIRESEAVEKNVSALPGPTALGDRRCMVYSADYRSIVRPFSKAIVAGGLLSGPPAS